MDQNELKEFLDLKVSLYNSKEFIETDPVSVPHQFSDPRDIEISGLLTATIAWGQRKSIIKNALWLMDLMENQPGDFIMNSDEKDWSRFLHFVHRTFNGLDCIYFLRALQNIYRNFGGMQVLFEQLYNANRDLSDALVGFRKIFFSSGEPGRTVKHVPDIEKKAAAKRLNMYLRWMIRKDNNGVDFGLWKGIPNSALYIPLDIHTGTVARKLGLLDRRQNDWEAVTQLTERLRIFDPDDPIKYDFALFGLGAFENF